MEIPLSVARQVVDAAVASSGFPSYRFLVAGHGGGIADAEDHWIEVTVADLDGCHFEIRMSEKANYYSRSWPAVEGIPIEDGDSYGTKALCEEAGVWGKEIQAEQHARESFARDQQLRELFGGQSGDLFLDAEQVVRVRSGILQLKEAAVDTIRAEGKMRGEDEDKIEERVRELEKQVEVLTDGLASVRRSVLYTQMLSVFQFILGKGLDVWAAVYALPPGSTGG